ncbi:hypothetical protein C3K47_14915 [Solitalea longa]|uniref:Outer membrane protein beta-barrel domain-containing protein n=1 Tax=Solitalea longa TaxID=2079460 RepID=A0A2S4ZYC6_9SPHI|nr:hypothetical protein [Solitalea longa]POY35354.1 hypothetical protein C3K47_14915 [Solitalea longa]
MKKLLAIVFTLSLFSSQIKAQNNEVYIGYGLGSVQEASETFSDAFVALFTGESTETSVKFGPIILGYNHYVKPKWTIGALYSNTSLEGKTTSNSSSIDLSYTSTYNIIMARSDYRYVNKERFQLYSGLAAGVAFAKAKPINDSDIETSSTTEFAFQINAIGFRYGKKIGVFGELGVGYNGFLCFGVSTKF